MTQKRFKQLLLILLTTALLASFAGCAPQADADATPTLDSAQAAGTMAAEIVNAVFSQMTQTAAAQPTATTTASPTATATSTLTPTATAVPKTSTPVYVYIPPAATTGPTVSPAQGEYQCSITRLEPAVGATVKKDGEFDFVVTMKNVGTKSWIAADFDFNFQSGAAFQDHASSVDMTADTVSGGTATFIVDMTAKTGLGTQTANWALVWGGMVICPVTLSINVTE